MKESNAGTKEKTLRQGLARAKNQIMMFPEGPLLPLG